MQFVALDTNIFIYFFQNHPEFGPQVKPLFESLIAGELKVITSNLTIAELFSLHSPQEDIDKLRLLFLEIPNLKTVDINEPIALDAARIRRAYNFRLPDAIQLATALFTGADAFITNDKRLQSFNEVPIKLLSSKTDTF
jgi:predicted nucleic acid-binding protein